MKFCLYLVPTDSGRGFFDYDLNDRTRNNAAKLIVKHFNKWVAQHFTKLNNNNLDCPTKWSSKQQNSELFQKPLGEILWQKILQMTEFTWWRCDHRCRAFRPWVRNATFRTWDHDNIYIILYIYIYICCLDLSCQVKPAKTIQCCNQPNLNPFSQLNI